MASFSVEEFCKYCDHGTLGLDNCSHRRRDRRGFPSYKRSYPSDQERYASRGFCGWATLEGLSISIFNEDPNYDGVKNLHIRLRHSGKNIPLSNLEKVKQALEEAKARGVPVSRKIPFPSVLDKLAQAAVPK